MLEEIKSDFPSVREGSSIRTSPKIIADRALSMPAFRSVSSDAGSFAYEMNSRMFHRHSLQIVNDDNFVQAPVTEQLINRRLCFFVPMNDDDVVTIRIVHFPSNPPFFGVYEEINDFSDDQAEQADPK